MAWTGENPAKQGRTLCTPAWGQERKGLGRGKEKWNLLFYSAQKSQKNTLKKVLQL